MKKNKQQILKFINEIKSIKHLGIQKMLIPLEKEISVYYNCIETNKNIKKIVSKQLQSKSKIQIGGGKRYLNGFINIDINKPADIVYDVREGIPVPAKSVNFIFTEHFLEHISYPDSVNLFFEESFRILKYSGELVVGVPDCGKIINAYTRNNKILLNKIKQIWYKNRKDKNLIETKIDIVNMVISDELFDKKYNPHYWGYDIEKIKYLFKKHGFNNIKPWKFNSQIANPKRKYCSIYLSGKKIRPNKK